jgi:hypothetical protein
MLYTHEEVEQLISQRVTVARAEAAIAVKPLPPPSSPPAPAPVVASSECFGACAIVAFLVFILTLFLFG